jgi:hypothetical protein
MPHHIEVLAAAQRIGRERGDWTFRPVEIVRALPHLPPAAVRTDVVSRCCVNAPANHPHRWPYFRRLRRGLYEVTPRWRRSSPAARNRRVAERGASYAAGVSAVPRRTVHFAVRREGQAWIAEGLELALVTQSRGLDELVRNLNGAVRLHLEGGDARRLGIDPRPRLSVHLEIEPGGDGTSP